MSGHTRGLPNLYSILLPVLWTQSHAPSAHVGGQRATHPSHSRTGAIVMFSLYASLRGAVLGGTAQWVKYLPIRPTV